jgi:putative DNA primase/helicase
MARGAKIDLPPWYKDLIVTAKGTAKPIIANIIIVLQQDPEFAGRIGKDLLRDETMVLGPLPWSKNGRPWPRQWDDNDDRWCADWLQHHDLHVGVALVAEAVQAVAVQAGYHPVLDYLGGLVWDGEPRLAEWPVRYLGCADSPYTRAVGAAWAISAVARVNQPGCKADCALVLEGRQGTGKSTALRVLGRPWFTDEIAALGTKDAAEQTIGVWIVELAELDAVSRAADIAHVKAFISRQTDRFRLAYGRRVGDHPRQCVFAATSNNDTWNRDDTGGRRWWPLPCGHVDVDGLAGAREQLWAEARDRYVAGEQWWITDPEVVVAAEREQGERTPEDPWAETIARELKLLSQTTTAELLTAIGMPRDRQGRGEAMRVAAVLRKLGWVGRKVRDGNRVERRYFARESNS